MIVEQYNRSTGWSLWEYDNIEPTAVYRVYDNVISFDVALDKLTEAIHDPDNPRSKICEVLREVFNRFEKELAEKQSIIDDIF